MNSEMTYQEALNWASSCIKDQNVDQNAPLFIITMMNDWTTTNWLMHRRQPMPTAQWNFFQDAVARVLKHEPAQYIIEKAPFYGRTFRVTRDVLVPESETEELIEWVLATMPIDRSLRVLDLGTGSGVIGVTLQLERPHWQVTLSDISPEALAIAQQNARQLGASVTVVQSDVFDQLPAVAPFDLIVTNPPYIAENEKAVMDEAVLSYEPPLALFASRDGLGIYDRIAAELGAYLRPGGQLFGETGFSQEQGIQALFREKFPDATIETRHDLNGLMRMVRVQLAEEKRGNNSEN